MERSLAITDETVSSEGQIFRLEDFRYKKGSVTMTFLAPELDNNGTNNALLRVY